MRTKSDVKGPSPHARERDTRATRVVVWVDREERDAARVRTEAARARELQETFEVIALAFETGELKLGPHAGDRFVRRLEHGAELMRKLASWNDEIADALDVVAAADRDVSSALASSSQTARRAGIHWVFVPNATSVAKHGDTPADTESAGTP